MRPTSPDPSQKAKIPIAGTNANAPGVGLPPLLTLATTPDFQKVMVSPGLQPRLPVPGKDDDADQGCQYEYVHMLGFDGSPPLAQLWSGTEHDNLLSTDVHQGGIGDCGMGAAMIALVTSGWIENIRGSVVEPHGLPDDAQGDSSIAFKFQMTNKTDIVLVDDKLPSLSNNSFDYCHDYLGYQAVDDGSMQPTIFMPIFEKAFAKWLDYRPELRSSQTTGTGYAGLEAVGANIVMAAVLGSTPKRVWRQTSGYDQGLVAALSRCFNGATPCVIGTPSIDNLGILGSKDSTGMIYQPENGTPVVYVADQQPQNKMAFTVIDFDQEHNGTAAVVQLVSNHAYAIYQRGSSDPTKGLVAARVALINPWGHNPDLWHKPSGAGVDKAEVVISLRALQLVIHSVYWVDDLPVT